MITAGPRHRQRSQSLGPHPEAPAKDHVSARSHHHPPQAIPIATRPERRPPLSRPSRYPGAGEALEELPLGRDAEKIAGRIVEYGTAVAEANWLML